MGPKQANQARQFEKKIAQRIKNYIEVDFKCTKGGENIQLYQKAATEVRKVKASLEKGTHKGQMQYKMGQMSQLRR